MRTLHTHKKAFTMIELVFAIVVLGIIASMALPRMERDNRQEAADNILSAIRYTQHLALLDNKTDPSDVDWQMKLWKIDFTTGDNSFYTVSSDNNKNGAVAKNETAIDPANGKYMYHLSSNPTQADESPNVALGEKYGIDTITGTGGCNSPKQIAFGPMGRPFNDLNTVGTNDHNDYEQYMSSDCNLTFTFQGGQEDLVITVKKETGYAQIVGQEDS
jgi:prepilin-type N-terminal cleavage/methylation domain-containing protein